MTGETLQDRIVRLRYQQAKECLAVIFERQIRKHGSAPPFIVVVGGTALSAHGVRELSEDVDYYAQSIDQDIVHEVETELRTEFGSRFKIDATPTENLWGPIIFRDIADSEDFDIIEVLGHRIMVKRLSTEDLILAKIAANRPKDREDLRLLASVTDPAKLVDRFNVVIGWHGDRSAMMSYADAFVDHLEADHGLDAVEQAERLAIPKFVRDMIVESRKPGDGYGSRS